MVGDLRMTHNIMQITIELKDNHIKCESLSFKNKIAEFLLDTGSSVNIIRLSCLKDNEKLISGENIYLKGINNTLVETIGIVEIPLEINKIFIGKTKFYIVHNDVPLIKSGIVGQGFLKEHQTMINMASNTITLQQEEEIKIPPRVECIMAVDVNEGCFGSQDSILVYQKEIADQVFIGNVLNKINNKQILVKVVNLSEEIKMIKPLILQELNYEVYKEENVCQINSNECNNSEINNLNRKEKIKNELRTEHLNKEEKESIYNICFEYSDIFHLEGDKLTSTPSIVHEIKTPTDQLAIYQRQYRLPHSQRDEINKQIKQMETDGIIEPSNSPWNSPMILVPKKLDATGKPKFRLVVDYRKLNNITVGDKMPLPQIQDVLDRLGKSKYFTVLDLASGFHQIPLSEESKIKSAFSSDIGHWQYTKLPMGLKNSPPTFQRLMNNVLCNLVGLKCLVYLDDIIIFSVDIQEHSKRLREIFNRLRTHNLKLQPAKCEFLRKEVIYLGHKISELGVQPDERKIICVRNFPIPTNVKEIKSFLGLTGYYRNFIPDYSKIAKPITNLLKKDSKFEWKIECQEAFQKLKNILISEPILQYPDFDKPFTITCDASNYAVGSVLSQGDADKELPIAYSSRTLNKAEINYSTIEKELVAIMYGVKQFRPYIYGRRFCIVTDHKPLTWLFSVKDPSSRLLRWRIKLDEFDYEIKYKSGKTNNNADALSRIKEMYLLNVNKNYKNFETDFKTKLIINSRVKEINGCILDAPNEFNIVIEYPKNSEINDELTKNLLLKCNVSEITSDKHVLGDIAYTSFGNRYFVCLLTREKGQDIPTYENIYASLCKLREFCETNRLHKIALSQIGIRANKDSLNWERIRAMIRYVLKGSAINVLIYLETKLSDQDKQEVIRMHHDSLLSGHLGVHKTVKRIGGQIQWKGMKKDVQNYIKICKSCQKNKSSKKNHIPMAITTTSHKPFQKIFLDVVGRLPISYKNNSYILTIQDDLTKFLLAIPLENHQANTIAKAFVENFVCIHGIPASILTDNGPEFVSEIFSNVCKILKIDKSVSSPYHPQTNGGLEKTHRVIKEMLRHNVDKHAQNWCEHIPFVVFSFNSAVHESTKYQPYELLYGNPVQIPSVFQRKLEPCYTYDNYAFEMKQKMQLAHNLARENLIDKKNKTKTYYDRNQNTQNIHIGDKVLILDHARKHKLTPLWLGPYEVIDTVGEYNIVIQKEKRTSTLHRNNVKIFKE